MSFWGLNDVSVLGLKICCLNFFSFFLSFFFFVFVWVSHGSLSLSLSLSFFFSFLFFFFFLFPFFFVLSCFSTSFKAALKQVSARLGCQMPQGALKPL